MSARNLLRIVSAVVVCALLLTCTALWREYPGGDPGCNYPEAPHAQSPDSMQPVPLVDCAVVLTVPEYLLKLMIALLALLGVAALVRRVVPRQKALVAAVACGASAVIAVFFLISVVAHTFGESVFPDPLPTLAVGTMAGVYGAFSCWSLEKWRSKRCLTSG